MRLMMAFSNRMLRHSMPGARATCRTIQSWEPDRHSQPSQTRDNYCKMQGYDCVSVRTANEKVGKLGLLHGRMVCPSGIEGPLLLLGHQQRNKRHPDDPPPSHDPHGPTHPSARRFPSLPEAVRWLASLSLAVLAVPWPIVWTHPAQYMYVPARLNA